MLRSIQKAVVCARRAHELRMAYNRARREADVAEYRVFATVVLPAILRGQPRRTLLARTWDFERAMLKRLWQTGVTLKRRHPQTALRIALKGFRSFTMRDVRLFTN